MSAGIILTQADLDNMVGGLCRTVNTLFGQILEVQAKLNALSQSGMTALPQGGRYAAMTTGDANDLMNAMNELGSLAGVYQGTKLVASGGAVSDGSGHDFRLYPQVVYGWGF